MKIWKHQRQVHWSMHNTQNSPRGRGNPQRFSSIIPFGIPVSQLKNSQLIQCNRLYEMASFTQKWPVGSLYCQGHHDIKQYFNFFSISYHNHSFITYSLSFKVCIPHKSIYLPLQCTIFNIYFDHTWWHHVGRYLERKCHVERENTSIMQWIHFV